MSRALFIPVIMVALILLDIYVFQAFKLVAGNFSPTWRKVVYVGYWAITAISLSGIVFLNLMDLSNYSQVTRNFILVWIFVHFLSKLFAVLFLFIDDLFRLLKWTVYKISMATRQEKVLNAGKSISRSEFLSKTAIIAAAVPAATMGFGIVTGAYNYRVRRKEIALPNLPSQFDGIRIGQLSDIHSGSFYNKRAVAGGVEMLLAEKPDLIFFTGDLVNYSSDEIKDYINVFDKVKAPLGVFSTLGNHDYGDYKEWPSKEAKRKNLEQLHAAHKELGWDLLNNENRTILVDQEKLGVIGVENWGKGRFPKYGDLSKAYQGMQDVPVKLLLSHDPSHWDKQVVPQFSDIDVTFSGHTHGFQFGVEFGDFKWSPSQYYYQHWAGLYQNEQQFLYVNRGFGFIGYPGRIGIWPEITIIELKKA